MLKLSREQGEQALNGTGGFSAVAAVAPVLEELSQVPNLVQPCRRIRITDSRRKGNHIEGSLLPDGGSGVSTRSMDFSSIRSSRVNNASVRRVPS